MATMAVPTSANLNSLLFPMPDHGHHCDHYYVQNDHSYTANNYNTMMSESQTQSILSWIQANTKGHNNKETSFLQALQGPAFHIPDANLGVLNPPPAAAWMRWAKIAKDWFDQVRSAVGAQYIAMNKASQFAAVAKQAAKMAQFQQSMKEQTAAVAVAKTLGIHPQPVGVPTPNAFGETPPAAPPYAFNQPNPIPTTAGHPSISSSSMGMGTLAFQLQVLPIASSVLQEQGDDNQEQDGNKGGQKQKQGLCQTKRKSISILSAEEGDKFIFGSESESVELG